MRVTWRTVGRGCPTIVRYAPVDAPDEERSVYGIAYVGDSSELCGYTAGQYNYRLHLHTAVMTGLTPNKQYAYRLANDDVQFKFGASKPAGDNTPFVFFVFGDMGVNINGVRMYPGAALVRSALMKEMMVSVPDFILDVGDISYANGNPYMWEAYMDAIQPFAARSPWLSGVGNHEYDLAEDQWIDPWGIQPFQPKWGNMEEGDARGECGLPVYWRFPFGDFYIPTKAHGEAYLPTPPHEKAFPPFYYSFDQGRVHVVMLSTEHDVEEGSAQMDWLENDLTSVDRCRTPFIVATGHRPTYAPEMEPKNFRTGNGLRKRLEHRLIRHRVDVFISGHVHLYYRLCEARDGVCVEHGKGLVSMVIGTAGHKLRSFENSDLAFDENKMIFAKWGLGKFTMDGLDRLEFSFLEAMTGRVLDTHTFHSQGLCHRPA